VKSDPAASIKKMQRHMYSRLWAMICHLKTKKTTKAVASFKEACGLHGLIIMTAL